MKWQLEELPVLFAHLPQAVHDLIRHEDPALVAAGKVAFSPTPPTEEQRHVVPDLMGAKVSSIVPAAVGDVPDVSLEKTLDPLSQRAAQNMGLLLHDYLYHLPSYRTETQEGEKLLEHWRKILQEQPQRLAEARLSNWNDPKVREFWKHRLEKFRTDFGIPVDAFPEWEEWQRLAGTQAQAIPPEKLAAAKARQWQDLVIRSRLHEESKAREMEW